MATAPVFVELAPEEKGFADYFQVYIAPLLDDVEIRRKAAKENYKKWFIIGAPITIIGCIVVYDVVNNFLHNSNAAFKAALLIAALFMLLLSKISAKFVSQSNVTLLALIGSFYGDCRYDNDRFKIAGQGKEFSRDLKAANFLPTFTNGKFSDFVTGKLDGTAFSAWKMNLFDVNKSTFKGLGITFEFPKNFKGQTRIIHNTATLGDIWRKGLNNKQKVLLEDIEFAKNYQVYSDDQVEARFLLTTTFLERLIKLNEIYGGQISANFQYNRLTLAISMSDSLFETESLFKSAYAVDGIRRVLHQFYQMREIVRILKLDMKIGL